MIYLDDNALIQRATDSDKAFHVSVRDTSIKNVYLDGDRVASACYVDLENNFVIAYKKDIGGKIVIVDGSLAHEIRFGKVTVEYR